MAASKAQKKRQKKARRKGAAAAQPEPPESAGSAAAAVPTSQDTARDDAAADRSSASAPAPGAVDPAKSEVDAASQQTTTVGEGCEDGEMDWMSCRLTGVRLVDPVVAADGESYERSALEAWLADKGPVSPATGAPLEHTMLLPNHALRSTLERLGTSTE